MASRLFNVVLTSAFVAVLMVCASAQTSSSSCNSAIVGLAPCLSFITGNATTPATSCCTQLASVVKSEPECLCMVLKGDAAKYGINVNQTQALSLPSSCKIKTPPVSSCNGVAPPTATPKTSTDATPSSTTTTGGAKLTPTAAAGSHTKISLASVFFMTLLVSYA